MPRPYGSHWLTEEQKKLAAENVPLVWWFITHHALKYNHIKTHEIDDCSGYLLWKLCMAAESYDPSKGIKFSTYAGAAIRSGLFRYKQLRDRFHGRFRLTDFIVRSHNCSEEETVCDPPEKEKPFRVGWDDIKFLFELIELTTQEEQVVFYHYNQRNTFNETAKKMGCTGERARQIHKGIIQKLKEAVAEEGLTYYDFVPVSTY